MINLVIYTFKAVILQDSHKIPNNHFYRKGTERTLVFPGTVTVPFSRLTSLPLYSGTVVIMLCARHKTVIVHDLFLNDTRSAL